MKPAKYIFLRLIALVRGTRNGKFTSKRKDYIETEKSHRNKLIGENHP